MDRMDSGFDESFCLKPSETEVHSVDRSSTGPPRRRQQKPTSTDLSSRGPTGPVDGQRPASDKYSGTRKSTDPRRPSIGSSSDHSTTRSHGHHGSKPSSRRTSCHIVDPSRPARHYRIKSSQTVPTVNRDVDDVLALHFRSCSLFQNPTRHAGQFSSSISGYGHELSIDTSVRSPPTSPVSAAPPLFGIESIDTINTAIPKTSEETMTSLEMTNTVTHWMSPSTRRREYEAIDRDNSGVRGLMRKIVPRCISGPPPTKFYEKDASDTCSVRRYRMDLSEDEADEKLDEKSTSSLRFQTRKLERAVPNSTCARKKRWGCF